MEAAPPALLAARAMPVMGTMGVHAARRSEDDNMIARNWFGGDNPECWERSCWNVGRFRFRIGRGEVEGGPESAS